MIAYTTSLGRSEVLVAGTYHDLVALGEDTAKLRSWKAVLDTTVLPRYLVYPV